MNSCQEDLQTSLGERELVGASSGGGHLWDRGHTDSGGSSPVDGGEGSGAAAPAAGGSAERRNGASMGCQGPGGALKLPAPQPWGGSLSSPSLGHLVCKTCLPRRVGVKLNEENSRKDVHDAWHVSMNSGPSAAAEPAWSVCLSR